MRGCLILLLLLAGVATAEPAKQVFGAVDRPNAAAAQSFGTYNKGCIAGAVELPETGFGWQAMRLSRNRNWGHPQLIAFIERLGGRAQDIGWPRLYIGDISQPRGGPMLSGHRSHQMGLDVDIWLTRPGANLLSRRAREQISAVLQVAPDRLRVAPSFSDSHAQVLRAAASDPMVARIFVNAAIKQRLCDWETGDRRWLRRIRPWWGHDHHFHVRLNCPEGSPGCQAQAAPPAGDGCDESLAWWFSDEALGKVPPKKPAKPRKPRGPVQMSDLPPVCAAIAAAP